MVIEEDWGISKTRIQDFFQKQEQVIQTGDGYVYKACSISLVSVEGIVMNQWKMERTKIRFEGPENEIKEIYQKFFLRFLSAGG